MLAPRRGWLRANGWKANGGVRSGTRLRGVDQLCGTHSKYIRGAVTEREGNTLCMVRTAAGADCGARVTAHLAGYIGFNVNVGLFGPP